MITEIRAKKDLYNGGKCFTKDEIYEVNGFIPTEASLMEKTVTNDLGEPHVISSWWREFEIVK